MGTEGRDGKGCRVELHLKDICLGSCLVALPLNIEKLLPFKYPQLFCYVYLQTVLNRRERPPAHSTTRTLKRNL